MKSEVKPMKISNERKRPQKSELSYDVAKKRILNFIAMADEYNKWRRISKSYLMINLAPRIGRLGQRFYTGCGFHYGMEQRLGGLIKSLSLPWQPALNHYKNLLNDESKSMTDKIIYDMLVEEVIEAEKGAKNWRRRKN